MLVLSLIISFWASLVEATYLTTSTPSLAASLRLQDKMTEEVLEIISDKTRLVSVTTFVDTISNIAIASTAGVILSDFFGPMGWLYDTLLVSLIIMVFLYLLPKSIGIRDSVRMSFILAKSTKVSIRLLSPVAIPLATMAKKISIKLVRTSGSTESDIVSEFQNILLFLEKSGHIEPDLAKIIRSAIISSKTLAGSSCTPLAEAISIPINSRISDALKIMAISKHPRLPVYDSSKKEWVGAVTFRSLMNAISAGQYNALIHDYVIQPAKVGADESLASVVQKMEETGSTIAFVFDSKGHPVGLITLSDIIENLIGIKV